MAIAARVRAVEPEDRHNGLLRGIKDDGQPLGALPHCRRGLYLRDRRQRPRGQRKALASAAHGDAEVGVAEHQFEGVGPGGPLAGTATRVIGEAELLKQHGDYLCCTLLFHGQAPA